MIVPPPRMDTGVQPTPPCLSAGGLAIAVYELGCMQEVQPELDLQTFYNSGAKLKHPWCKAIFERLVATRPPHGVKKAE